MMGITNCLGNIMSILGPLVVGFIVTDKVSFLYTLITLMNRLKYSINIAGFISIDDILIILFYMYYIIYDVLCVFQHDPEQWRIVWLISAAIYVAGNTFFVIFGSGETQPWNNPEYSRAKQNGSEQGKLFLHLNDALIQFTLDRVGRENM